MADVQTNSIYVDLQFAYNFYNEKLFDGKLEPALLTLQRHKNMLGYICFDRFSEKNGQKYMHELALNSDYFAYRTTIETLSTMVHEQVHLFQRMFGQSKKQSYHDHEFKDMMFAVGLVTSQSGEVGGKPIGQKMDHYIDKNGKFLKVSIELLEMGFELPIYERHTPPYIKPAEFYSRALKFIENFEGILKPENLRPMFLNEILLQKAQEDRNTDRMLTAMVNKKDAILKPEPKPMIESDLDGDLVGSEDADAMDGVLAEPADIITEEYIESEPLLDIKVESVEDLVNPIRTLLEREVEAVIEEPIVKPNKNKCKYKCTNCLTNIWGKPNLNVMCGDCEIPFVLCS